MAPPKIICVGAVYIDTILSIPHFPAEDSKLRATSISQRRGGNTANSLEVLSGLITALPANNEQSDEKPTLHLLSPLPARHTSDTHLILSSLPSVDASHAFYRPDVAAAASSYILASTSTDTRTIVSANPVGEMTVSEFKEAAAQLLPPADNHSRTVIHFEGREPQVLAQCLLHLTSTVTLPWSPATKPLVSLELEKPQRSELLPLTEVADVCFFSRAWAEHAGYHDALTFLNAMVAQRKLKQGAVACCTWGSGGAAAVRAAYGVDEADQDGGGVVWATTQAWHPAADDGVDTIRDSVGAGDAFIAGFLYCISMRPDWCLDTKLRFANQVAGRKVRQYGFQNLGECMVGFKAEKV